MVQSGGEQGALPTPDTSLAQAGEKRGRKCPRFSPRLQVLPDKTADAAGLRPPTCFSNVSTQLNNFCIWTGSGGG